MTAKWISTQDAAKRFGLTSRTLRSWAKRDDVRTKTGRHRKGAKGKAPTMFAAEDIETRLTMSGKAVDPPPARKKPAPRKAAKTPPAKKSTKAKPAKKPPAKKSTKAKPAKAKPTRKKSSPRVSKDDAVDIVAAALAKAAKADGKGKRGKTPDRGAEDPEDVNKESMVGTLARVRMVEQALCKRFVDMLRDPKAVPSRIATAEKMFLDAVGERRRLEKDVPAILEKMGEVMPMESIIREVARGTAAFKQVILGLPRKLAPELAAIEDPAEIETRLQSEIDDALENIANMIGKAKA